MGLKQTLATKKNRGGLGIVVRFGAQVRQFGENPKTDYAIQIGQKPNAIRAI